MVEGPLSHSGSGEGPGSPESKPFRLRFRGVRGSIPTPEQSHLRYGGNTPCVEVETASGELLIIDAGSGLRALGLELMRRPRLPEKVHIFFTHFHWDHVQGVPYFAPLFAAGARVAFYSSHAPDHLHGALAAQMRTPYFPVPFEDLPATMEFHQIHDAGVRFGDLALSTFPLHHPQGSVGYRLSHPRRTVVYATDHEHGEPEADHRLRVATRDADVLIYDAQYTPEEYRTRQGWGHSTWLEGTHIAKEGRVGKLVLFHHDPMRDDAAMDSLVESARKIFPRTEGAREGHPC